MGNDAGNSVGYAGGIDRLAGLRIALCQPEIVQGDRVAQRKVVDEQLALAREHQADFAILPDMIGITGKAIVVALGDTQELATSDSAVELDVRGERFLIGLDPAVEGCDLLALQDDRPFVLSGYKNISWGIPTAVVSPVGMTNVGKIVSCYQGKSRLIAPSGRFCACLRDDFAPEVRVVSFSEDDCALDTPRDHLLEALKSTIARFDAAVMPWHPKWVIGLSGGLDSSIVATLLVLALGPERVIGYNMATRYNTQAT